MPCARQNNDLDIVTSGAPPGLDARLDGYPAVVIAVEEQRRDSDSGEDRLRVEEHLLRQESAGRLGLSSCRQLIRQEDVLPPRLVCSSIELGVQPGDVVPAYPCFGSYQQRHRASWKRGG